MPTPAPADGLVEFAAICERFIALCDDDPRPEGERLRALRTILAELIAGVDRLPSGVECYDPRGMETEPAVRHRIGSRFPSLGFYNGVIDVLEVGEDVASTGDAIDDLVDIRRELASGLALLREGQLARAAGHWRFGFSAHWGDHAIGALGAIHAQLGRVDGPPPADAGR